jgi:DNA-binding transcriptional ArsR family regulator
VIDRLREQIQQRLDQLANEAERLRKALAALDPRPSTTTDPKPAEQPAAQESKPSTRRTAAERKSTPEADVPARTAPGATKAAVLAALAGGEAMTAGEVAAKSGLARGTVSTTLSKLAKTGEVHKADRGYQLAPEPPAAAPPA